MVHYLALSSFSVPPKIEAPIIARYNLLFSWRSWQKVFDIIPSLMKNHDSHSSCFSVSLPFLSNENKKSLK
jgi:hypothetical protein